MATNEPPEIGIVGLGRMGGNLALQAVERGMRVVGFTRGGVSPELRDAGVVAVDSLAGFAQALRRPRKIFLYIPSGPAVDQLIDGLLPALEVGDVIVDAGAELNTAAERALADDASRTVQMSGLEDEVKKLVDTK